MIQINQRLNQSWISFNHRFISIPNKLWILLPGFSSLWFSRVPRLRLIVLIKISSIQTVFHLRYVWRLPISDLIPVDAHKERMRLDLFDSVDSQPLLRISYQLPSSHLCIPYEISSCSTDVSITGNTKILPPVLYLEPCFSWRLGSERRIPDQHLKENNAHRPPINCFCVSN